MSDQKTPQSLPGSSIRDKLRRLVFLSVTGVLLAVSLLTLAYQGWMFANTLIQRMSVVARMTSANVAASLQFGDERQADKLLQSLRVDQNLVSVVVISEEGDLFAGYGPGVQQFLQADKRWLQEAVADRQPIHRLNFDSFEYVAPVILHDEIIGHLYLISSLHSYYQQFLLWAAVLFGVSLVVGWLALWWATRLQQRIVRPFEQLAGYMGRVSEERDFSLRAPREGFDEIVRLTDGFNHMLGELEQRDQALKAALSEANEARVSAEAASTAKSLFLATMSHEIRTPMNGVLGMAELLLASRLDDEQRSHADSVLRSGQHLLGIINDILDFSKIESGHMTLENVGFDLRRLIVETLEMFTRTAADKGIALSSQIVPPDGMAAFYGDSFRLRQILDNLVSNAVKFTDQGEVRVRVEIAAAVNGRHPLRLEVEDTGIGIPPEAQERVFQQFSQADGSTTRQYGGTGLGLAICQRLVELMGGRIGVESTAGKGSCFWVEIALQAAPDFEGSVTRDALTDTSWQQISLQGQVLLVEDNPVNQRMARAMLGNLGLAVEIAEHGEEALALAAEKRFDLILMDCNMPRMDGYRATQQWREHEARQGMPRLPIIAQTANAMESDRQRCFAVGMDDYLAKPFSRKQLAQVLARWLPVVAKREEPVTVPDATATPTQEFQALDRKVFAQLAELDPGGESGLIRQILQAYQESTTTLVGQLSRAMAESDAETLRKVAHSLKSSSANVGAVRLSALLAELESRGRQNQLEEAPPICEQAITEYNRVMTEIDLYLKGQA